MKSVNAGVLGEATSGHGFSRAEHAGEEAALAAEGMAVPKRHASIPGTYFVPSRTWESRPIFFREPVCQIFVDVLFHYRNEGAYRLHSFVLMPDHFHALLTPGQTTALERAMQFIKGGSAYRIRKQLGLRFPVWQRGFSDHRIRNAQDFDSHVVYIEENPVKKGLATAPPDFPWSSASGAYSLDGFPQGLKPTTLGGA